MNATQLSLDNALAEKQAIEILSHLRKDDLRYLLGPIVYHAGGWDAGPLLPKLIPTARLELLLTGERDLATLEETLAYLSSASYVAPLLREDAELMFWLTQEVMPKCRPLDQPIWEMLGERRPFEMSDYLRQQHLDPLRRKLRAAVVRNSRALDPTAALRKFLEVLP
jgi:hypothetical protein